MINDNTMTHGKNICNQLKEVRKRIAVENDIPLEIEECSYKGECRGTCPRCEAEVRYLENALADRLRLGKVATVAGLALGLAATAQAQAPQTDTVPVQDTGGTHSIECHGVLKGTVLDKKTQEPIPFCSVWVLKDGKKIHGGVTDYDGVYVIKPLCVGTYTITADFVGYQHFERDGVQVRSTGFTILSFSLESSSTQTQGLPAVEYPLIEVGGIESDYDFMPGNPPFQSVEREGVKVIVR